MRRALSIFLAVLALMAITTATALAAITFHDGPDLTWDGNSATVTGDLSGLGNTPATATLTVSSFATYTCQNPGGNTAPGQTSVAVFGSPGTQTLSTAKNGRATLDVTASAPAPAETVSGKAAGCPNGRWIGVDPQLTGPTTATLTITQGNKLIFTQTYEQ